MTVGQDWLIARNKNSVLTAAEIVAYVEAGGIIIMETERKCNQAVIARFFTEEYTDNKVFFQLHAKTCHKLISNCVIWPIGANGYQKELS